MLHLKLIVVVVISVVGVVIVVVCDSQADLTSRW